MRKSPLETYGKKTVFTAERQRQRNARLKRIFFIFLLLVILVVGGWFGYKKVLAPSTSPNTNTSTETTTSR